METNTISGFIVEKAILIHKKVGPGCFERVYEELLYFELIQCGLEVERQLPMPIDYKHLHIKDAYRLDLLVESKIIIEIKSVEYLHPIHFRQLTTYLALTNLKNGILLNFKVN
jgi:GxxExxY protein